MITKIQFLKGEIWYANTKTKIQDYHLEYINKTTNITTKYDLSIYFCDRSNNDEFIVKDLYEEIAFNTYNDAKTYAFKKLKDVYENCYNQEIELIKYLEKNNKRKKGEDNE